MLLRVFHNYMQAQPVLRRCTSMLNDIIDDRHTGTAVFSKKLQRFAVLTSNLQPLTRPQPS